MLSKKLQPLALERPKVGVQGEQLGAILDRRRGDDRVTGPEMRMPGEAAGCSAESFARRRKERKGAKRAFVLAALSLTAKSADELDPHLAADGRLVSRHELPDPLANLAPSPSVEGDPDACVYEDHRPRRRERLMAALE